jgi:hypothetical protein
MAVTAGILTGEYALKWLRHKALFENRFRVTCLPWPNIFLISLFFLMSLSVKPCSNNPCLGFPLINPTAK